MGRAEGYADRHRPVKRDSIVGAEVVHAGRMDAPLVRTVGPPIQKGSTVLVPTADALYDDDIVTYGRGGLATQAALTSALAALEHADAVHLFPSGLAALTGGMLAVLKAGDEVLVTDAAYKPTRRFCNRVLTRYGVSVRYHHPRAAPEAILAMATKATRLIVMESPGSLTFDMQDAPAIARLARERGILTMMDNTWAAGLYFKPLDHGIDLSVQALTKYVGGHADVFMGSVATRGGALGSALDQAILDFGWAVAPEDAYQMLRGLRTLPTRMARHQDSGLAVARWLGEHPQISRVIHPALPNAVDHAMWKRDYSGAAGLFAVVLRPRPLEAVRAFLDALQVFGLGFSWGGFESLALNADPQFTVRTHLDDYEGPVLRLNIGLEDPDELIIDLERGFAALGED